MIAEADIERVLEFTDLVALANQYLPRPGLRKAGVQMVGYCPFHQERTPSFYVHPTKQFYHCKGCGAGGNAINFLIQAERLSFPEAVRSLAARAGITLQEQNPNPQRDAYAAMIAAEAAWMLARVRRAYNFRLVSRMCATYDVHHHRSHVEDCWELLCLQVRLHRSWRRWERILKRLDAMPREIVVRKYYRYRTLHPEIVKLYRNERDPENACAEIERQALAVCASLSPERFESFISMLSESVSKHTI